MTPTPQPQPAATNDELYLNALKTWGNPEWQMQHDATIRNATIIALQEKMCDLYDDGMKNPLATFDAAVFELYNINSLRRSTPTKEAQQR